MGVVPGAFERGIGSLAASSVLGRTVRMDLKLWHGLNPEALTLMAISAVTFALGLVLFAKHGDWFGHFMEAARRAGRLGPARAYAWLYDGLMTFAAGLTRRMQNGYLRRYLMIMILATILVVIVPLLRALRPQLGHTILTLHLYEAITALLILGGGVIATVARSRLTAISALGVTGLSVAILFALFAAPDLAITQIMVEVLTIILLVLIFHHLPEFARFRSGRERLRDGLISLALGATMTLFVIASTSTSDEAVLADYYARTSYREARAGNLVNAILVDYRSLDTWGETIVIGIAGLGVYAMLRPRLAGDRKASGDAQSTEGLP